MFDWCFHYPLIVYGVQRYGLYSAGLKFNHFWPLGQLECSGMILNDQCVQVLCKLHLCRCCLLTSAMLKICFRFRARTSLNPFLKQPHMWDITQITLDALKASVHVSMARAETHPVEMVLILYIYACRNYHVEKSLTVYNRSRL